MIRPEHLQRLRTDVFDLCIIGGGASGAGCALDAALRGLKVALVEKTDFAAGTSSRSTKLIHGGVRYLEQAFKNLDLAQLRQVRHGLQERHILLHNAPHLTQPLAIITPVFSWWAGLYFRIGLWFYAAFAARKDQLPPSRWLSRAEALRRMPGLSPRIHSAVLYYDGQLDDARYCLALVQTAAAAGAVVVNYAEVVDFQKDAPGKLVGAILQDAISNTSLTVQAKVFLNCTGPSADSVRQLANTSLLPRIRPSKGVHVVLPATVLGGPDAMLIPKTPDGRIVFAIPFEGQVLLGTTDEDYPEPEREAVLEAAEATFLLDTLQPFLAQKTDQKQIKAGFGGLRPLVVGESATDNSRQHPKATKRLLRDHEVEYDPSSGLFSLLGGKWTTYRVMARDAIDAVCTQLKHLTACTTNDYLLFGATRFKADGWQKLAQDYAFNPDVAQHIHRKYGDQAPIIGELTKAQPVLLRRLHPDFPYLAAEVVYAAQAEMACTVRDMLARRIRLEGSDWQAAKAVAPEVARLLGETLGWPAEQQQRAGADYQMLIDGFMRRVYEKID